MSKFRQWQEWLKEVVDYALVTRPSLHKDLRAESYAELWDALQRIDTAAVAMPTFEVRHDGGIDAVTQNIVDAMVATYDKPN